MQSSKTLQSNSENKKNNIQSPSKNPSTKIMKTITAKFIDPKNDTQFILIECTISQHHLPNKIDKQNSDLTTEIIIKNIMQAITDSREHQTMIWSQSNKYNPEN